MNPTGCDSAGSPAKFDDIVVGSLDTKLDILEEQPDEENIQIR